jgi:hypothetical protein
MPLNASTMSVLNQIIHRSSLADVFEALETLARMRADDLCSIDEKNAIAWMKAAHSIGAFRKREFPI